MDLADIQELWNEVCCIINAGSHDEPENIFEEKVVRIVSLLGWKEYRGEIKRKPKIPTGRTNYAEPDIVLYDDNERPCIIIEVKRPSEILNNTSYIDQLSSYMGLFRCNFGILFGKQAHVYYEGVLIQSNNPILIDEIFFDKNNELGHQFIKFLTRKFFLSHWYEEYVKNQKKIIDKEQNIQKLRRQIVSEETKQRIHEYLVSDFSNEFDEDMVIDVLQNLRIELALTDREITQNLVYSPGAIVRSREHAQNRSSIQSGEYSLISLAQRSGLSYTRPSRMIVEEDIIIAHEWVELDIKFVKWLIDNKYLTQDKLPIETASHRGKYFVNKEPKHRSDHTGDWVSICPGYYVDTKYNADAHLRNYKSTLEQLKISNLQIKISLK